MAPATQYDALFSLVRLRTVIESLSAVLSPPLVSAAYHAFRINLLGDHDAARITSLISVQSCTELTVQLPDQFDVFIDRLEALDRGVRAELRLQGFTQLASLPSTHDVQDGEASV
jgi:hypothetical protein